MLRESSFRLLRGLVGSGGGLTREPSFRAPPPIPTEPAALIALLSRDLEELRKVDSGVLEAGQPEEDSEAKTAHHKQLVAHIALCVQGIREIIYPPELGGASGVTGSSGGGGGGGGGAPAVAASADSASAIESLARAMMEANTIPHLLGSLIQLEFETRKSVSLIFKYLVGTNVCGFSSEYLAKHEAILDTLMTCYHHTDAALPSGLMLRECIKQEKLHCALLVGENGALSRAFTSLLDTHVKSRSFEVAADAFETLQQLLTTNKGLVFRTLNPERSVGGDEVSELRCV